MARVFYSPIVDENLLIKRIFWFLSPGIINHIFCSELLKAQLLRQRSFQNETENEMKFSESCLFSLMPRRCISSEMGLLRSPKQLHQLLSWVLMCQLSSSIRNLGKTSFSENFMLLSNVNPPLNSFQKLVLGFYIKYWVRRCKAIFFAAAQLVQKISFCVVQ